MSISGDLVGLEEALTNELRNDEEEEVREEPLVIVLEDCVEEKPRPCLNLAAPSPFRVSSS